jgi:hypothetical protein
VILFFLKEPLNQLEQAGIASKNKAVICRYLFIGVEIFVLDESILIDY